MNLKFQLSNSKSQKLLWEEAKDINRSLKEILSVLDFPYIKKSRIFCYRTIGSKSRSYARIWSFPKIFQTALNIRPAYVIEVLSKHYDKLDENEKKKVLIHELLHIPKNFSGALLPHKSQGRHLGRLANKLFEQYKKSTNQ
jgi:predicted metallopeptidase